MCFNESSRGVSHGCGDAYPCRKLISYHRPTVMNITLLQASTHEGDAVERQDGHENMSLNPLGLMVPDRPQPPFRLEGAEMGLAVCSSPIGLKDGIKISVGMAGAKDVSAGDQREPTDHAGATASDAVG